jgi:hypothetical protein
MKAPKPKYPGDAAIEKLMARHGCPTPFHIARMRALGEIVSLKSRVNPVDVIKSFWGDDFPSFKHEKEAADFFNTLLGHWNHMARRRTGSAKIRLGKTGRLKDWESVAHALRHRAEEIRDGFLAGFTTEQAIGSYPAALNDAITGLKSLSDQFDQAARQIETDPAAHTRLDINDAGTMIAEGSTQLEKLLDVLCTVSRAIGGSEGESGEGRVH